VLFRNGNVAFVTWLVSLWKPMALSVQLFSMTLHIPRQSDVVAFLINTNHVCHNIIGSNYTAPRFTCNIHARSRRDGVYQMPMLLLDDDYRWYVKQPDSSCAMKAMWQVASMPMRSGDSDAIFRANWPCLKRLRNQSGPCDGDGGHDASWTMCVDAVIDVGGRRRRRRIDHYTRSLNVPAFSWWWTLHAEWPAPQ